MSIRRNQVAQREKHVGDHLPYLAQVDEHTIVTRDRLAMQVIRLEGLPFETIDDVQLEIRKIARDAMLQAVGSARFALVHHVVRRIVDPALEGDFDDPFSAALDKAWTERLATRKLYVNDLYLTIIVRPLAGRAGAADRMLDLVGSRRSRSGGIRRGITLSRSLRHETAPRP